MRRAETFVAAALTLFGLVMLQQARQLPFGSPGAGPGSGFFPLWLSLGVTLCAGIVLVQSLVRPREDGEFIPGHAWRPLLIAFLPMLVVVALMNYLGIYLGGALYLAGYMRFVGRFRWASVIAVSVAIPLVLFMIFEKWFLFPMPKGLILEYLLYGR